MPTSFPSGNAACVRSSSLTSDRYRASSFSLIGWPKPGPIPGPAHDAAGSGSQFGSPAGPGMVRMNASTSSAAKECLSWR